MRDHLPQLHRGVIHRIGIISSRVFPIACMKPQFDFQIIIRDIFTPDAEPKTLEYSGTLAGAKQMAGKAARNSNAIQLIVGTDLVAKRNTAGTWHVTPFGRVVLEKKA